MPKVIDTDDLKAEFRGIVEELVDSMSDVDRRDLDDWLAQGVTAAAQAAVASDPEEKTAYLAEVAKFKGAVLYKIGQYKATGYEAAVQAKAAMTEKAVAFGFKMLLTLL